MFSSFSSTLGICKRSIAAMHAKPERHCRNAREMDSNYDGSVLRKSDVCFLLSNTYVAEPFP